MRLFDYPPTACILTAGHDGWHQDVNRCTWREPDRPGPLDDGDELVGLSLLYRDGYRAALTELADTFTTMARRAPSWSLTCGEVAAVLKVRLAMVDDQVDDDGPNREPCAAQERAWDDRDDERRGGGPC